MSTATQTASGSGENTVATLNGDLIAKGSITASKIAVGGQNLILDPFFEDLAYWRESMATQGTVENGVLKISLENVSASADGSYIRGLRSRNIAFVHGKRYRVSAKVKVTVESYISLKTKQAGKSPVGSPITLSFSDNVPCMDDNPIDYFYQRLTAPVPEDYVEPSEEEKYQGWINPYLFAGGKIKSL